MLKFKLYYVIYILILMPFLLKGQSGVKDLNKITNDFFSLLKDGKIEESIDKVYSYSPWSSSIKDDIEQLKSQFVGVVKIVGEYNGEEIVVEENIANRLVYKKYMLLFDRQPLTVQFVLYRAKDEWIAYGFSFTTDIDDLLEEKAKLQFLNESTNE